MADDKLTVGYATTATRPAATIEVPTAAELRDRSRRRIDELEAEIAQLRTENLGLRAEIKRLKTANDSLRVELDHRVIRARSEAEPKEGHR